MGTLAEWLWALPMFDSRRECILRQELQIADLHRKLDAVGDLLANKTLELESLKNKITERAASVNPILKAKSAAEIRRIVEQQNERELEEANGF